MTYLLDANCFIEAAKRFYGFDIVPAYWDWLDTKIADGTIRSIDEIRTELLAREDDLAAWVRARPVLFQKPGANVPASRTILSTWTNGEVTNDRYTPAAQSKFFAEPDYHLIAHAHANRLTVVTLEISELKKSEIKIPDACAGLSVACMTLYEMLRIEKAKFVLA